MGYILPGSQAHYFDMLIRVLRVEYAKLDFGRMW